MKIFKWTVCRTATLVQSYKDQSEFECARTFRAVMNEAHRLAEQIPAAVDDLKPEVCRELTNERVVTWRIRRLVNGPVFMRVNSHEGTDSDRWVVYVNARQFYLWWRWSAEADPTRLNLPKSCKNRPPRFENIESDHKYSNQGHWKDGSENPTVIPDVAWNAKLGININDGMTRTMWLIRNGAAIFPVEATEKASSGLYALVGYSKFKPIKLADLLSHYSNQQ